MSLVRTLLANLVALGLAVMPAGCGQEPEAASVSVTASELPAASAGTMSAVFDSLNFGIVPSVDLHGSVPGLGTQTAQTGTPSEEGRSTAVAAAAQAGAGGGASAERRIIYTARISLVVEDFANVDKQLRQMVKRFDGYLARSHSNSTQSEQRCGEWLVRLPVDRFDSFVESVVELGVPESRLTNAQDVTEEFVDLRARLANKQQIEQRILKLLEQPGGAIKDIIVVETELGRVREEIERMQGRMRYLTSQAAMTTVAITAREERNYVPEQSPAFAAKLGATWWDSWTALRGAGQGLLLAAVAVAPWLIVALPLTGFWWVWRRRSRPVPADAAVR